MENQKKVDSRIVNWTQEEKLWLYQGIKKCGSRAVSQLSDSIPGKSEEEIKAAIQFYKENTPSSSKPKTAQKRRRNKPSSIPLAGWANLLVETHGFEDLKTELATALYLIADCEFRPPAESTNNIDFRKVYIMLAEAVQGKPLQDDPPITRLFDECITETAVRSKEYLKGSKFNNIIKSINVTEREMSSFNKPTDNMELAALRHLLNQKNYNPLYLTEDCLLPTTQP